MAIQEKKIIEFDEGWNIIQTGINKLNRICEGLPEPAFTSEDYMNLYETVFTMCRQNPPHDYTQQLYDKYGQACEDYINSTVLPSLRNKHNELMLRELVKRWANYKVMVRWLSRFFHFLDRYFIPRRSLPTLNEVGVTCFRELVYEETKGKARDAVIALIDQEREGEQIDRTLLKNVVDLYVEIGIEKKDYYVNDFENEMLTNSAAYYSRKASNWIVEDSCPDYMLKVENCLSNEKERVSHYLHSSSEAKLLKIVQNELLAKYSSRLIEDEHSGFLSLLRDNKMDDLSRMYRLFSNIRNALDPVPNMFKQHVIAEGMALVQQAEEAASTKDENVGDPQKQMFVKKLIELHEKFRAYVIDCFMGDTLFHKAMKDAFTVICNKNAAVCSNVEAFASYCDNTL